MTISRPTQTDSLLDEYLSYYNRVRWFLTMLGLGLLGLMVIYSRRPPELRWPVIGLGLIMLVLAAVAHTMYATARRDRLRPLTRALHDIRKGA